MNNKYIWIPFGKIMLEFDLQFYQPLLNIHTFVLNEYDLGHENSILPLIEYHERIQQELQQA
jgi:hypothetical protein